MFVYRRWGCVMVRPWGFFVLGSFAGNAGTLAINAATNEQWLMAAVHVACVAIFVAGAKSAISRVGA
jgi:hypothetical protein